MSLSVGFAGGINSPQSPDVTAEQAQDLIQQHSGLGGVNVGSLAQATAGASPELQHAVAEQLEPRDRGPYMQALNDAHGSQSGAHQLGGNARGGQPAGAHPPRSESGPQQPGGAHAHQASARQAQGSQVLTNQATHFRRHITEEGETLESIVRKYHLFQPTGDPSQDKAAMTLAIQLLKRANSDNAALVHLSPNAEIKPGTRIDIPDMDV